MWAYHNELSENVHTMGAKNDHKIMEWYSHTLFLTAITTKKMNFISSPTMKRGFHMLILKHNNKVRN